MFKSDFKIVADYFVQMRKNKNYVPSRKVIKHVAEVLQLLQILTGYKKYEFDEKLLNTAMLKVLRFDGPTAEWAEFIYKNRHRQQ